MSDRIEKRIELKATPARVWRALTDHREFGEWFGAKVNGPFAVGQMSRGRITYPGYEHLKWEVLVEKMEPERLFLFRWSHPKCLEKAEYQGDFAKDPKTLVEFRLETTPTGTLLKVTESGFEKLPVEQREEWYRRNEGGWAEQMKNVEKYVAQKP